MRTISLTSIAAALMIGAFLAPHAQANTTFTYQGVLQQAGSPVNGTRHMRFGLWDAAAGGAQIGSDLDAPALAISDGAFTIALDFGPGAFDGADRWLQVQVVSDGGSTVTTLTPRQAILPAPYAMRALGVADGGLPPTYAAPISLTNAGNHFNGTFAGSGAFTGATTVTGGNLVVTGGNISSDGTIAGTTLVGSTVLPSFGTSAVPSLRFGTGLEMAGLASPSASEVAIISGGVKRVSVTNTVSILAPLSTSGNVIVGGNVGIGTSFPAARLHMVGGTPIHAETADPATGARAILGWCNAATGATRGVYARSDSTSGTGLYAWAPATSGFTDAVYALSNATGFGHTAVSGELVGSAGTGYGVHGTQGASSSAYAIYSLGRFAASGTKSFRIDHPLDPENKYLFHYCAEAPEPLNIYSGSARLNDAGEAIVQLPEYFDQINRIEDARIQLTPAGAAMPDLFASEEIVSGGFRIAGGRPGGKVYWEVKAVRNDRWVRHYGAPAEIEKHELERGLYQHPETYGLPPEKGIQHMRRSLKQASDEP